MAAMALSRTAPRRAPALVSAAVAGGASLVGTGLPAFAAAAPAVTTHAAATSTLITVTVDTVPVLSVNAFQGSYATSTVAQNGGDNTASGASDPSGVLDRITLDQPAQSKTHSDPAKNWADAQPAVEYTLHGKKLYSISSVDAHAECTPSRQGANTYVHTAPDSLTVLGTKVGTGNTMVPVTGAQLGVSAVDHGSLDVSYTTTATSTHAYMDLGISGVFYDHAGRQLYSGPLQKLRLGDVQVACQSSAVTTSAPTSASGATHAPHKAGHSGYTQGNAKSEPGPAAPENGPLLPAANAANATASGASDGSLWWALLSVLGLGGGVGLYLATRQRGRHQ